jgi:hypothetical protein
MPFPGASAKCEHPVAIGGTTRGSGHRILRNGIYTVKDRSKYLEVIVDQRRVSFTPHFSKASASDPRPDRHAGKIAILRTYREQGVAKNCKVFN